MWVSHLVPGEGSDIEPPPGRNAVWARENKNSGEKSTDTMRGKMVEN